jgi:hypothetical protein
MIHCLFEQSGTFRDAFKALGHEAQCYDIENRFGKTDVIIDLFSEIDKAHEGKPSLFDSMSKEDITLAFFPCTYFSGQNNLIFNRQIRAFKGWVDAKIDKYIEDRYEQRELFFEKLTKMIDVYKNRGLQLIIENPSTSSYLINKSGFIKPQVIITNRSTYGDDMRKPTAFWFVNIKPKNNQIDMVKKDITRKHNEMGGIARSVIHPDFARTFILKHIL